MRTVSAAGPSPRPGRLAGRVARLPPWLTVLLAVLAWAAALAAVAPIVYGYLTSPPDQRLVDLDVYRAGGLAVLRGPAAQLVWVAFV